MAGPQDHRRPGGRRARRPSGPIQLGGNEVEAAETIHVFTARDGTEYGMPKVVPGSLSMEALERFRDDGEVSASLWLVEEVFGPEGYDALKAEATGPQLEAVLDVLADHVRGAAEGN
jgi:hypothetical protein